MIHSLFTASGGVHNLAGAAAARIHLTELRKELRARMNGEEPLIAALDFADVQSVTSSYLKNSLVWLIRCGQRSVGAEYFEDPGDGTAYPAIPVYPVVANVSDEVREELEVVLGSESLCCVEMFGNAQHDAPDAGIIGTLDRTLRDSYRRVAADGSATATSLHERYGDGINVTGWNNRLADLHRLRLVWRRKEGRQWIYAPVSQTVVRQEVGIG